MAYTKYQNRYTKDSSFTLLSERIYIFFFLVIPSRGNHSEYIYYRQTQFNIFNTRMLSSFLSKVRLCPFEFIIFSFRLFIPFIVIQYVPQHYLNAFADLRLLISNSNYLFICPSSLIKIEFLGVETMFYLLLHSKYEICILHITGI